jgi:peptidylprolyl isomerase
MVGAKHGDTVKVHYTGMLDDGTIFDSSWDVEPLEFTLGEGTVIKGFESAVVGMSAGETKKVNILSDDAYGPYRDDFIININRSLFPPHIEPIEGLILDLNQPGGGTVQAIVIKVTHESVTLDANHPLAGKDLTFEIDLLEIIG